MNADTPSPVSGRREVLKLAAAASAVALARPATTAEPSSQPSSALVDTNVSLSHWPLRRLPGDDPAALVAKLRSHGVTQAWAGSFDALLHRDMAAVNARLAADCQRYGEGVLVPFGSVNPCLPDWEDDLRRCAGEHRMPGIRVFPGYSGCKLDDPVFVRLLDLAATRGLLVQLAVVLEDRRMMHPLLQVEPPDLRPLAGLLGRIPGLRLQLLGMKGPLPPELLQSGRVSMEISMIE